MWGRLSGWLGRSAHKTFFCVALSPIIEPCAYKLCRTVFIQACVVRHLVTICLTPCWFCCCVLLCSVLLPLPWSLLLAANSLPQSRSGMPGLDAFQLVDIMVRLTRKDMAIPTAGDDLADFQQFVASGGGTHRPGDDGARVVAALLLPLLVL